jgi:hypothetical protein
VGRGVKGVGRAAVVSSVEVSVFTRAIQIMQTRAIIATFVVAGLGVAIAGLLPALALVTAAVIALGAIFLPAFLVGIGVVQRFKDTVNIAGSAASELRDVLNAMKSAWNTAVSPAAAITMRAISDAMVTLLPLVRSMRGPLVVFAEYMGAALRDTASGLAAIGPQLREMIAVSGPLFQKLARLIPLTLGVLVDTAIYGAPVLHRILDWLVSFMGWLRPAVAWMDRFARSGTAANWVAKMFHVVSEVAKYLAGVIADLAGIAYQLYMSLLPVTKVVAGALLWALNALADVLDFVNKNFKEIKPLIAPLVVVLGGLAIGWWAVNAAATAFNMIMAINPVVAVIAAVVALGVGLYVLYRKSETFRNAVAILWNLLKISPLGLMIQLVWRLGKRLVEALGGFKAIGDFIGRSFAAQFDFIKPKVEWLMNALKWVINNAKKVTDKIGSGGTLDRLLPGGQSGMASEDGLLGLKGVPGLARGGEMRRGGVVTVGERGREKVYLPSGSVVRPQEGYDSGGGGETVMHWTLLMPDGDVLARGVERAARRKAAVR